MDIMKQPLHPRVWAWLELAIEAGVDGQGPIFASAKWATETSSSHLVQSALPEKEKMMMMMMMILKIKIPGTPSPPRANDPRGRFSVIWDKTQRSLYCGFQSFQWHSG